MVKVIMGLKGSGKTKQLVHDINAAVKNESGSMVCIEKGTKLRYDIDMHVRLIDYQEYSMGTLAFLKGFISGLHAGNFDISHIFIDSFYKLVDKATLDDVEDSSSGATGSVKPTAWISPWWSPTIPPRHPMPCGHICKGSMSIVGVETKTNNCKSCRREISGTIFMYGRRGFYF